MVNQGFLPGFPEEIFTGVPDDLKPFQLYAKDKRLCRQWQELKKEWERTWSDKDIMNGVTEAHKWEVANASRRKRDRPRFLNNWLSGWARRAAQPDKRKLPTDASFRAERETWFDTCDGQMTNAPRSPNTSQSCGPA